MLSRYAGVGSVCPSFSVSVTSGGSLTGSGTLYFSFQLQNRAGFNAPSVSAAVNYSAGQKIQITIPNTVRKDGWDIHYFVISAGATNDPSTHVAIARYAGFDFGVGIDPQTIPSTLPTTIELSRDSHIALASTVADLAALPTGDNRLNGMVRWVTSESKFFEYRADSDLPLDSNTIATDVGQWVRVQSPSTYVANSSSAGGSDYPLVSIQPTSIIPTPPYPGNGTLEKTLPTWESKYFIYNDTNANLPEGTEFGIELDYNNRSSPDLLSGLFMVKFFGYVQSNGTLRTTKTSDNTEFNNIGGYVLWTPKLTTNFLCPDDLLPGESILIGVKPFFSAAELSFFNDDRNGTTGMNDGDIISVRPSIRTESGDYNPLGFLLNDGSIIPNLADKYRVVPDISLGFKVLSGCALVKSYSFPVKPTRSFGGLLSNVANQKIVINGNASVFAAPSSYTILSSEALRAIVSTVAGESKVGTYSAYVANGGTSSFIIEVNYPCDADGLGTIRTNYPDVVAENNKGSFNPITVNFYIQRQDTLEVRRFTGNLVIPGVTQEFFITNWNDGTVYNTALPSAEFGLFEPLTATLTADVGGVFPATSYRICYSFVYDGDQVTDISHASPPCIYEWGGDFQPPSITIDATTTLPAGNAATVVNTGTGNQAILSFSIPQGVDGAAGQNAYTTTTAQFTVPNIGANVTITVGNSDWTVPGQIIFIQDAGSYEVIDKPSSTQITVKNSGNQGNAAPATVIATGRAIAPGGATGLAGTSGYTTTTAQFTVPSINANVTVNVVDSNWMPVGLITFIGGNAGYYEVMSKPSSTQVELKNLGESANAAPATVISSGVIISSGGAKGATGTTGATGATGATGTTGAAGQNAFTTTTATFSQPNVGNTVTISVGNSSWVSIGQVIFIYTGGSYQVVDVPGSTSIQILNLGYPENAIAGSSVNASSNVSPGGIRGEAGATGSVSAVSELVITEEGSAPATAADQLKLYNQNNNLKFKLESNGAEITIAGTDRLQAYTKTQFATPVVNNSASGTVTLDGSASNVFILTLTGNITDLTMNNIQVGATYIIYLIEDATGGATITLNSIFKRLVGDTTTFNTAANRVNMITGIARSESAITLSPIAVEV
jgi:hypothetical protein